MTSKTPYVDGYDEGLRDGLEGRVPRSHHSSITREERRGYRDGWRDAQERKEAQKEANR